MEQRIGPNIQPLQGAAVDPAAVPGITGPRPAEPGAAKPAEPEDAVSKETASDDEATKEAQEPSDARTPNEEPSGKKSADTSDTPGDPEETPAPDDGPVFEASDRRAKIVADHRGVRLTLDDQEAEFRWDEIGAVETESPRFGKRFTITVHTPDRRWYPLEIEAKSRASFQEWETGLDEVLDAYFEEAEEPSAS
ncbi:hypothetical protein ACTMUQ_02175 [Streptomyces sp. SD11]|uniref:hypothetical protein n=1 Tax=Streptomyces sp. SD11 TaxID=3452209 RepID=UPI003F88DEB2